MGVLIGEIWPGDRILTVALFLNDGATDELIGCSAVTFTAPNEYEIVRINAFKENLDTSKTYTLKIRYGVSYPGENFAAITAGSITTGLAVDGAHIKGNTRVQCLTAAATGACNLKKGDYITIDGANYRLLEAAVQASAADQIVLNITPGLQADAIDTEPVTLVAVVDRPVVYAVVNGVISDAIGTIAICNNTNSKQFFTIREYKNFYPQGNGVEV
jgi:hypothetical protein